MGLAQHKANAEPFQAARRIGGLLVPAWSRLPSGSRYRRR